MITYTQCRDCGGLLWSTNNDTVHPLCTPKPTRVELLAQQWLDAIELGNTARETELQRQINELDARPPRMLESALLYASWGWPVFPLKVRGKQPATRNGFKDATTDRDRIRAWWTAHPDSNIGLPTGIAFDVLDIDVPEGAFSLTHILAATVDARTGRGILFPDAHGLCATASGGAHYYIAPQGRGNKAAIMTGVDIRGAGGYVVAPPSSLDEPGRSWSWVIAPSPAIKNLAMAA